MKSVQAHCVDLESLNEHWVSSFFEGPVYGLWGPRPGSVSGAAAAHKLSSAAAVRSDADQQQPKRKRSLSLWNVFWSEQVGGRGAASKPSAQEVSDKYKQLSDEERARLADKLKRARVAADAGAEAPLGGRSRQQPSALALALPSRALARRSDEAALVKFQLALATPENFWASRVVISKDITRARASARESKGRDAHQVRSMAEDDAIGGELARALFQHPSPQDGLQEHQGLLDPCLSNSPSLNIWEWQNTQCRSQAALVAGSRAKREKGAKHSAAVASLHQCLGEAWKSQARVIQHVDVPQVVSADVDAPKLGASKLCWEANECRCGRNGQTIVKVEAALTAAAKKACGPSTLFRGELKQGHIVMMLLGNLPRLGMEVGGDPANAAVKFWHISDVLLSPYQHFYHELEVRSSQEFVRGLKRVDDSPNTLAFDDTIRLSSTGKSYEHYEVAHLLGRSMVWEVAFCQVVVHEALEGHFLPNGVDVKALPNKALYTVWDPHPKRMAGKATKRPADEDWQMLLADRVGTDGEDADNPAGDLEGDANNDGEGESEAEGENLSREEDCGFLTDDEVSIADDTDGEDALLYEPPLPDMEPEDPAALVLPPPAPEAAAPVLPPPEPEAAAPVLPPPAPRPVARAEVPVGTKVRFNVEGIGELVWYNVSAKRQEFYAFCPDLDHVRHAGDDPADARTKPKYCRQARAAIGGEFSGRPLGFLMAWLLEAAHCADSYSHVHLHAPISRARRVECRQHLSTLPGSHVLFERERPLRPGEDTEPA